MVEHRTVDQKIGFIGAGRMARALAGGFVSAGLLKGNAITASDPAPDALAQFAATVPDAATTADNSRTADAADVVILAVKPQQMAGVLAGLKPHVTPDKLVVSIAAGIRLAQLAAGLSEGTRLVRVMPNTPCLVGQSASAFCTGGAATEADGLLVGRLLSAVGKAYELDEKLLDAVTGLSGSGPAFVCVMIEALSDGGVRMGLPRETATALAVQTVRGTAQLLAETGQHPAEVKDAVTSPGGTTIAGLQALETGGVRAALVAAVEAATRRAIELGGG